MTRFVDERPRLDGSGNGKVDVEGEFVAGTAGPAALANLFGAIGGINRDSEGTPHTFDGVIDEVRVYSRSLTDDEVLDLYRGFLPD